MSADAQVTSELGHFTVVQAGVLERVTDPVALKLYLHIAMQIHGADGWKMSRRYLADTLGVALSTIDLKTALLRKAGVLDVSPTITPDGDRGWNRYVIKVLPARWMGGSRTERGGWTEQPDPLPPSGAPHSSSPSSVVPLLGEAHASQAATPGSLEQGVSPRAKKPKPEGQGRGGTEEARKATALAREFIDKRRAHGGVIPLGGFAAVRERMQDCYEAGWPEDEIRAVFRAAKVFSRAALEMERTKLWPSAKSDVEQRELRAGESIGVTEADHDAYWAEEERRRAMTREERDAEDAARFALWCAKHPEEVAANKAWRATHPEAEAVWRESNPDAE